MAYTLQRDAAVAEDRAFLTAGIARSGTDTDAISSWVAESGSVALFERALEEADFVEETPMIDVDDIPEEAVQASIIEMSNWVRQVNAANEMKRG